MEKEIKIQKDKRTIDSVVSSNILNIVNNLPFYNDTGDGSPYHYIQNENGKENHILYHSQIR